MIVSFSESVDNCSAIRHIDWSVNSFRQQNGKAI
jgi:hypothetical protein